MQDKALVALFECLSEEEYTTSDKLADMLKISLRTVRNRIKELNYSLKDCGAFIDAKPRYGYRISIRDSALYHEFREECKREYIATEQIPSTGKERVSYLLAYLLNHDDYVKSEMLMDFLYISKGTLTSTIKQVENMIAPFGLKLERRPGYGIRVMGDEFNIRRCMGEYLVHKRLLRDFGEERQSGELDVLAKLIMECADIYGIKFTESVFERFVNDIFIQIKRIRSHHYSTVPQEGISGLRQREVGFIDEIQRRLSEQYGIEMPKSEQLYIAVHLAGKRMVGDQTANERNFIIQENINKLSVDMLETIYEQVGIDLRSNFELRMTLNQHLVPLDIRIRFGLPLANNMLDEIKEKYMMGYNIAAIAATVLHEYYHKPVAEDEIGYLALIFALAWEQMGLNKEIRKFRILVVCNSGKGISRLLMYRFKQVFSDYISHIYVSDLQELSSFDFKQVDYVFTTVPIRQNIPVPIQEVGVFLEEKDLRNVRRVLESGCKGYLVHVYREEHFFAYISGNTREEVLEEMCRRIYAQRSFPSGLYESVMEREFLWSTDFGNQVAIPHPNKIMTDETLIYVAILEKPIIWSRYPVQVVMLMLIGRLEGKELQDFYEMTTRFIADREAIDRLIEKRNYESLTEGLMKQIGI